MPPKLVALIVAASLTAGWLLASVISPPVARLQSLPERARPRAAAPEPAQGTYTEQLHLKLQDAPRAPVPRRNPFVFGAAMAKATSPASPDARTARVEPSATMDPAEAPAPRVLRFRLSGVGASNTADGLVRTAVLSDGVTVFLLKVGEKIAGYTVTAIDEESATLSDAAGLPTVLRLR